MTQHKYSWMSPKIESRPDPAKGVCGVFCKAPIAKDELIVVWTGWLLSSKDLDPHSPNFTQEVLQIEDDLYLVTPMDDSECFNHSCDPNAGMSGPIALVAMRDIAAGEEISFDYAMCDGSNYDEFECNCGAPGCRGRISGDDWKRQDLWVKYDGYFAPYLARRIARLKKELEKPLKKKEVRQVSAAEALR